MAANKNSHSPRLNPIELFDLTPNEDAFFGSGESYDSQLFERNDFAGIDLSSSDFLDCELKSPNFDNAQLRGARFRNTVVSDCYAPIFKAARSSWRDVAINTPRWGSAELYDSTVAQVRIDGGKLDYLNLRQSKVTDLLITDCIIEELDLGGANVTRLALKNCRIGTLDVQQATLSGVDLRSSDFRTLNGIGSMSGVIIDDYQLGLIAPVLAAHVGIQVL